MSVYFADCRREPSCTLNHDMMRRELEDKDMPATPCPECDWIISPAKKMSEYFTYFPDRYALYAIAEKVHEANKLWWTDLNTGEYPIKRNIGELLMLVVTELSEALEGDRKSLMDDKLTNRKMFDVEIVDTFIRLFDIAGALIPEFGTIFEEKMRYNKSRKDHSKEGRMEDYGKKY